MMKEKKMFKISFILLIIYMMTTSFIGSTIAKYTSTLSSSSSAKIAKWGIVIQATGGLFEENSILGDGDSILLSSNSSSVSPGSSNQEIYGDNVGLTFTITGTAEVSSKIKASIDEKSIYLKAGTYPDFTTTNPNDTFKLEEDYYPIIYTLEKNGKVLLNGKLEDIIEIINNYGMIQPNTAINDEYKIFWQWNLNNNDKADTILGKTRTGKLDIDANNYNILENVIMNIRVEQVD